MAIVVKVLLPYCPCLLEISFPSIHKPSHAQPLCDTRLTPSKVQTLFVRSDNLNGVLRNPGETMSLSHTNTFQSTKDLRTWFEGHVLCSSNMHTHKPSRHPGGWIQGPLATERLKLINEPAQCQEKRSRLSHRQQFVIRSSLLALIWIAARTHRICACVILLWLDRPKRQSAWHLLLAPVSLSDESPALLLSVPHAGSLWPKLTSLIFLP